jgi:uncharacterized RDD family membrane protein YckC
MSERPRDGGLTSGDPLSGGDPEPPRHESGLPGLPPEPPRGEPEPERAYYSDAPPPGAGGVVPGTPAAVAGSYQLSGWWRRVGATVIDSIILIAGAVLILLLFAAIFSAGPFDGDSDGGWMAIVVGILLWFVAFSVIALLYAPVMMARTNGQTLGKMAVGIRVIRATGAPMTFWWAMLREVVVKWLAIGIVSSFTMGLANLLDVLWPLWDEENRAIHDLAVDTRVVLT